MEDLEQVPQGARPAARILLIRDDDHLLLLEAREKSNGQRWWVAPGGGLEEGEGFRAAAKRELIEETGTVAPIGPWVWTRRHIFSWEDRRLDQYERFFVARGSGDLGSGEIVTTKGDSYIIGHRWWSLDEIEAASADTAPRRLAKLLPPILRGDYPDPAIDCGV